jgi:hypothetical protein
MCLVWPLWNTAFPDAKWVIVRRRADDIAKSCVKTPFMRAFRSEAEWLACWVMHHEWCFNEMINTCSNVTEIWPETFIKGDVTQLKLLIVSLGLEWKEKEVKEFISPELWKGGKNGN